MYVAEITSPGRLRRFEITREYGVFKVDMHAAHGKIHGGLFDFMIIVICVVCYRYVGCGLGLLGFLEFGNCYGHVLWEPLV